MDGAARSSDGSGASSPFTLHNGRLVQQQRQDGASPVTNGGAGAGQSWQQPFTPLSSSNSQPAASSQLRRHVLTAGQPGDDDSWLESVQQWERGNTKFSDIELLKEFHWRLPQLLFVAKEAKLPVAHACESLLCELQRIEPAIQGWVRETTQAVRSGATKSSILPPRIHVRTVEGASVSALDGESSRASSPASVRTDQTDTSQSSVAMLAHALASCPFFFSNLSRTDAVEMLSDPEKPDKSFLIRSEYPETVLISMKQSNSVFHVPLQIVARQGVFLGSQRFDNVAQLVEHGKIAGITFDDEHFGFLGEPITRTDA